MPRHNNPLEVYHPLVMREVEPYLRQQEPHQAHRLVLVINQAMLVLLAKSKGKLVHLVLINLKMPHLEITSRICWLTLPSLKPSWELTEQQQVLVQQDLMQEVEQLAS